MILMKILDLQFDFLLLTVLSISLLQLCKMQNTYQKIYKYYLNGPSYGRVSNVKMQSQHFLVMTVYKC